MKPTLHRISVFSLIMLLSLLGLAGYSQGLKGRVAGPDGAPLPAVTVLVKGTNQATMTNADGQFFFKQNYENATLVFSSIEYVTQEVAVDNHLNLSVIMAQGKGNLSEVVVTAFGIKKEDRKIGYAVQTIKGSELNKARDVNVFTGLEGKVAGVTFGTSPEILGTPQIVARGV